MLGRSKRRSAWTMTGRKSVQLREPVEIVDDGSMHVHDFGALHLFVGVAKNRLKPLVFLDSLQQRAESSHGYVVQDIQTESLDDADTIVPFLQIHLYRLHNIRP